MAEIRAGGIRVDARLNLSTFEKDVNKLAKELNKTKKAFVDLGKNLSTTLTAPLAAFGAAAIASAKSYSAAFKEIERTTGATGESLKGLERTFRNVFTSSNRGPADVALAISRIRVETGSTGTTLEGLAKTILNLSTVTGSDLRATIDSTTGVLDNWSIANEEATSKLNVLFGVSQKTGIQVNDLAEKLRAGGPTLRAFGVQFEEAASMVGLLADKGLDVEKFFGALDKLPKKIKDTGDLSKAFEAVIKSVGDAKDGGKALDTVIAGFGAKGATQTVEALKLIRAELDKTKESVAKSAADINKTMSKTEGVGEKLQNLRNILTDALVPIGSVILDVLKPALEKIKPYLESFAEWMRSVTPDTWKFAAGVFGVIAAIGPLSFTIGAIIAGVKDLVLAFVGIRKALAYIAPLFSPVALQFIAISAGVLLLYETLKRADPMINATFDSLISSVNVFQKEFELGLAHLVLKIEEWAAKAIAPIERWKNNFILNITAIKEELGLLAQGSAWSVWESQNKGSTERNNEFAASQQRIARLQAEVSQATADLADKNNTLQSSVSGFGDSMKDLFSPITNLIVGEKDLAKTSEEAGKGTEKLGEQTQKAGKAGKEGGAGLGSFNSYLKDTKEKADKAKEAVENLQDRLASDTNQASMTNLREGLSKALESVNTEGFAQLKQNYLDAVRSGVLLGLKDTVAKAGVEGQALAEQIANRQVYEEKTKLEEELADRIKEKHKAAYEESVQFWRNTFENAITGTTFSLKDSLSQIAVGFGAEVAANVSSGLDSQSLFSKIMKGAKSPQDMGSNLAQYLFGGAEKPGLFSGTDTSSIDSFLFGQKPSSDFIGPLLEDGRATEGVIDNLGKFSDELFAGANTMEGYTSAMLASIGSFKKLGKGTGQTVDGTTEIAFAGAGALFGGPVGAQIGSAVGDVVGDYLGGMFGEGPKNKETIARNEVVSKIEELINKVGGIQYFDSQGQKQNVSDIALGGSDTFNQSGWADNMWTEFGDKATSAFVGVGNALTDMLGITEDVGSQIGQVLLTQFEGDTEALKAFVQTVGLTYDDFVNLLIERGKQGQESWLAIVGEINAGADAFKEGLDGFGQYLQAFRNVLNAQGSGQISLNQMRNVAVEAAEAGITSLDMLRQMLAESGQYQTQEIEALFSAFQTVGIGSIEQLRGATDLQLAQIIASMDAYFQDHGTKWSAATADIAKYEEQLKKLEDKKINIDINLKTNFDSNTDKAVSEGLLDSSTLQATNNVPADKSVAIKNRFAFGGILSRPTMVAPGSLAGENGLEGYLPLKWINGKLGVTTDSGGARGVGGGVVINIDARGADSSVEPRLYALMRGMEDDIVERSVNAILDANQRGGYF